MGDREKWIHISHYPQKEYRVFGEFFIVQVGTISWDAILFPESRHWAAQDKEKSKMGGEMKVPWDASTGVAQACAKHTSHNQDIPSGTQTNSPGAGGGCREPFPVECAHLPVVNAWVWHRRPLTFRYVERGHLAATFRNTVLIDPMHRIAMRDDSGSSIAFRRIIGFLKWAEGKGLTPKTIDQTWSLFGAMMAAANKSRKDTG